VAEIFFEKSGIWRRPPAPPQAAEFFFEKSGFLAAPAPSAAAG
jgi:hypothetical protein